jgi:hypothetical protein
VRQVSPDLSRLWELVALEIVIVLIGEMLAQASMLVERLLGDLYSTYTNMCLMEHAATLDLYWSQPTTRMAWTYKHVSFQPTVSHKWRTGADTLQYKCVQTSGFLL